MSELVNNVLESYFASHREQIDAEQIDGENVVVSFPLHFSGGHRVELAITNLPTGSFAISDMARTIGELKDSGYGITRALRTRLEEIAISARIKVVRDYLVTECTREKLGDTLHAFAEAAKTIGDVYLVHRNRAPVKEDELHSQVREVLLKRQYVFKEFEQVNGEIESHRVDFYMPPNGKCGLALAVLPHPTRLLAEAWAFKAQDLKSGRRLKVGLIYDAVVAKEESKEIISRKIDIPVAANELEVLGERLKAALNN